MNDIVNNLGSSSNDKFLESLNPQTEDEQLLVDSKKKHLRIHGPALIDKSKKS